MFMSNWDNEFISIDHVNLMGILEQIWILQMSSENKKPQSKANKLILKLKYTEH